MHTTGGDPEGARRRRRLGRGLGRDALAGLLLDLLRAEDLDTSTMTVTESATSDSIVTQASGRDRTFWPYSGANEHFDGRDLDLDGVDLLHVGYPNLLTQLCLDEGARLVELFQRARDVGCATSVDLAVVELTDPGRAARWTAFLQRVLPYTDVVSPSLDDLNSALDWQLPATAEGLAEAAEQLLGWGVGVALVTAGTAGLQAATGDAAQSALGTSGV